MPPPPSDCYVGGVEKVASVPCLRRGKTGIGVCGGWSRKTFAMPG